MVKKTILITGAGSGFGRGAAIGLAKLGHDVIESTNECNCMYVYLLYTDQSYVIKN
jgi:short-subunit dehydrogenase involved in D-alanine esterification of teichoic acids